MNTEPTNQPSAKSPPVANRYSRQGITIVKRSSKVGAKYTTRIRFKGTVHQLTLCETVEDSFKAAVLARREIQAGRWESFKEATALRAPEKFATLQEIRTAYEKFPGGDKGIKQTTKDRNLQALDRILRSLEIPATASTSVLTAKLITDWKWKKREQSAAADDSESQKRILRSAQSEILQARSVFSPEALSYYRSDRCKLNLPDGLDAFVKEPGFSNVAKDEYHAPADDIIAKTFETIAKLEDRNIVVAFWLAIGFGLRAGEISLARKKHFETVAGDIFFRPDWRVKNKKYCEIGVQLDAWTRLAPKFENLQPDDFVLSGTETERTSDVFRRVSELFRTLGWQTTHHIHEMRAWAGCQIAMHHPQGLLAAKDFMRHSTMNTTQQYYGHHIKVRLDKVALRIPTMPAAPTVGTPLNAPVIPGQSDLNRLHFAN